MGLMYGELPDGVSAPHVGDEVLIRGKVVRWVPTVGAVVELFSKTDQYEVWIRPDRIAEVIVPNVPDEPADGTWLLGEDPHVRNARVFQRDDAEGHCDRPERRHDRHWWDVVAEEWIDWPEAVRRGADPARRVREVTDAG
ncbi:hypothetical protein O7626_39770 [Micromonospora sp. WMMD1102]|uniref:hypothetical protein n=1 Tax=Micromonospora sp. WMMD1102 TaxID=3016105 RepID=UPI002415586F|nr:hypothetical protein [Micromonospora sp. WMMD1102]MDG4791954.1 hypothetical protein [Micromonospora sp. WMMD1102]